ncbi:MAG: sigma-70 RNA polymerase sigma factor region 4 domain-containing protein [Acidithiobacillus sp.]
MSLIDAEGQRITPETLSRAERNRYEHEMRESSKCSDAHKIEAYAYANLVKGFSECFITGDGSIGDTDITVLSAFSSTFNSADLPSKPWDDVSEEQFNNTHKLFRSPWIARAADVLGAELFLTLVSRAIKATREIQAEHATYNEWDMQMLGGSERESLAHDEMLKHYPRFAEAFNPYPSNDDDYDWAAEESIKITAAAAYAVNSQHTSSPRESAAITPRRQTGGSDSDDSASDDHDSHVLSYLQHINSLICWTSALEVIAAIAPAAKTIQKHTYQIGNFYLELSDYPSDITPDYSFQTLVHAAMCLFNPEFSLTFSPTLTTPIPCDLEMWRALLYYQVRHKISAVAVAEMATRFYPTARESLAMDSILSGMMTNLAKLMVKRWKNLGDAAEVKDYHSEAVAAACRGLEKFDLSTFHSGSLSTYLAHWMRKAINVWREVISKTSNPGLTSRMATENRAAAADVLADAEAHLALLDEDAPEYFPALRAVSRAEWHMAECNQSLLIPEAHLLSNTHEDEAGTGARDPGSTPDSNALQSQSVAVVEYLLGTLDDSLMRNVYISKHVHELKTVEISDLYNITQEKVRKYLRNAQAILSQAAAARGIRSEDCY